MCPDPQSSLLWWLVPGWLAGMPMPYLDPMRRMSGWSPLLAFDDELVVLHREGIRAVVSLLNIPSDSVVYELAGFRFLCLPIADGHAPTPEQADRFVNFVDEQMAHQCPVAVHCEAGIGRTGTLLATYLISHGAAVQDAIARVRRVEPSAIETHLQVQFLHDHASRVRLSSG